MTHPRVARESQGKSRSSTSKDPAKWLHVGCVFSEGTPTLATVFLLVSLLFTYQKGTLNQRVKKHMGVSCFVESRDLPGATEAILGVPNFSLGI